jgi:hypothetical protein
MRVQNIDTSSAHYLGQPQSPENLSWLPRAKGNDVYVFR